MNTKVRPAVLIFAIGALAFSLGYIAFPHSEADHAHTTAADLALDEGTPAPEFEISWLDGTPLSSADLKGKVVVVDFWATWCGPCLTEIPHYNELHTKFADRGVQMLGVTLQSGSAEQVRDWIARPIRVGTKEFRLEYPVAMGNDEIETSWGPIFGFPTTFLVDQNWRIRKRWIGAVPDKAEQLDVLIEQLLAEPPAPAVQETAPGSTPARPAPPGQADESTVPSTDGEHSAASANGTAERGT